MTMLPLDKNFMCDCLRKDCPYCGNGLNLMQESKKIDEDFKKRFLTNTDETGRCIITSLVTGKKYFIEPINNNPQKASQWGDWEPGMKTYTGKYGKKYIGSITEKESMINEENGFKNIITLEPGESPISYIDRIDKKYQEQMENKDKKEK